MALFYFVIKFRNAPNKCPPQINYPFFVIIFNNPRPLLDAPLNNAPPLEGCLFKTNRNMPPKF